MMNVAVNASLSCEFLTASTVLILDHLESQEASKEVGDKCAPLECTLRMA